MGIILGLLAAVVAVVGLSAGAIALGRAGSNAEIRKRLAAGGMSPEQAMTLREAERDLRASRKLLYDVRNDELRLEAKEAIDKADKLVEAMKAQPEEIRRANQFFIYYVPTIQVVIRKYLALEASGTMADDELANKAKEHMTDMSRAFELLHDNMYKDEALDLTVEVEAMQMALKREGLS